MVTADVGTVGLRQRTKIITPDSTGFFDQFGNYVGPGTGYDVELGDFGDEMLTGRVDLSGRLRWASPGKDLRVPALLRHLSWEGFVNLRESSSLPLVRPRYFFSPGSYLDRETTLDGRLNQRQTVDISSSNRSLGLRLRQEFQKQIRQSPTADSLGAVSGLGKLVEIDSENRFSGTLRANPASGWDTEIEGALGSRREEVESDFGASPARETETRSGTLRGGRRFELMGGRGRVSAEFTYSRELGDDREARGWVVRPRIQWSLPKVGRVDLRYSRTDLTTKEGFVGVRGPGAPSLTEGWRLELLTEVRLNRGIVLTGGLSIEAPEGLSRIAEGRTEVRGTF